MPMSDVTAGAHRRRVASDTLVVTGIVLASVLLVLVVYAASTAFLLVFAALLLAAIFCGLGHLLQRLGLPRAIAMVAVYLLALAAIVVPIAWGGIALVQEFNSLLAGALKQADRLWTMLGDMGLPVGGEDGKPMASTLQDLLPNSSGLAASAQKAIFSFLGGFGNLFVVVFLAIFISWQPRLYRSGVTSLFPRHKRARIGDVLDRSARSLILWVAGDAISMATIFVVSWAGLWLISMPNAFLLALQAGLLAFIPTLGAFVAGVIILLSALAVSPEMALWALGVYVLIQGIESNVTTPIAQRYMTALAPALTLGFQILFGLLFGLLGFILAVPFLAVLKVLVDELYIRDVLGGAEPAET
ncbi:hypothetical protein ASG43_15190 [Aureimonas sp. Leaf454]|nr:hypothetical protein ASG43_15190 [Aureimonas sp. Leaf454]